MPSSQTSLVYRHLLPNRQKHSCCWKILVSAALFVISWLALIACLAQMLPMGREASPWASSPVHLWKIFLYLEIIGRVISPSIPWMSLLLLDRLSEILACWELMEPSTSSVARGSEVTDAWEMLLWEEWLPPSKRLLKRILKRQKANTFIEEILVLLQRISYTFFPLKCSSYGVFIFKNSTGCRYWTPNLDVYILY